MQWYRRDGEVIYWNRASEAIYGWSAAEMVGACTGRVLCAEDHDRFMRVLAEVADGAGPHGPAEFHAVCRDGERRIVLFTVFAIPGEDGQTSSSAPISMSPRAGAWRGCKAKPSNPCRM